jgi:hypothetical protein
MAVSFGSFRVDGSAVNTDSTAPYSYDWDSSAVTNRSTAPLL